MPNTKSKKQGAAGASKNYKSIKIAVTAVAAVILAVIITLSSIYIHNAIKLSLLRNKIKSNITRYTYCLAIDYQDKEGFAIPTAWMQGLSLDDFSLSSDNPAAVLVNRSGIIKAKEDAASNTKATLTYRLDGKIACSINVHIIKADGYVSSQQELAQLDGATGTYIQTQDIILSGSVSIKDFKGKYYGNHKVISGHNISGGGLFDNIKGGGLYGIALTNIGGAAAVTTDLGALVNKAQYSKIEYCSAEGGFTVSDAQGGARVGGLVGYIYGSKRTTNEDFNIDYINACTTNLDIQVSGGSPAVGGIAGEAINIIICNTTVRGNITIDIPNAASISKLYAGGIAGALTKEYETAAYKITYLDISYALTSHANITVNLTGGGQSINTVYAGGIFGSVTNQSVRTSESKGYIKINGGGADLIIGGIAGNAHNKMSLIITEGSIRMYIEKCAVTSAITVDSTGRLYAGGLVGRGVKIDIEDTISTVTPVAAGDRDNIITVISDGIGYNED